MLDNLDSFLNLASNNSFWKGYYLFCSKRVISFREIDEGIYEGIVLGSEEYNVSINTNHPRKSKCNCPYADGKIRICKHKVALFFAVHPEEAKKVEEYLKNLENEEEEKQRKIDIEIEKIKKQVATWSIEELRNYVVNTMANNLYDEDDNDYYRWR